MIDRRRGKKLYPIMSGEQKGPWAGAVRSVLGGMSAIYAFEYRRRMRGYQGMEKVKLDVPVISVGNITLGGTGKTPVCRYLAKKYELDGKRVGIATRGYGREGAGTGILRSGEAITNWHHCGDEPLLFLRGAKDITVAIDINRAAAARILVEEYGCDIILLDDGFQFVTLKRDMNIVVLDAFNPFGFERLIPAGLLREPVESLKRADVFWLAKSDMMDEEEKTGLLARLGEEYPDKAVVESVYRPEKFSVLGSGATVEIEAISGKKALCMSGIGNPESFENLIHQLSGKDPIHFRFTDHHPFSDRDLMDIEDHGIRNGVDIIITTEKDAVRIPGFFKPRCEWWVLEININILRKQGPLGDLGAVIGI